MPMALSTYFTELKFRQYQLRAISLNLMLAKISHYTASQIAVQRNMVGFVMDGHNLYTQAYHCGGRISFSQLKAHCLLSFAESHDHKNVLSALFVS